MFPGRKKCACSTCSAHRLARRHAVHDALRSLNRWLGRKLRCTTKEKILLAAALKMLRGRAMKDCGVREPDLRKFLRSLYTRSNWAFDELIRFKKCETEPALPSLTGVYDHTTVNVPSKSDAYFSGKHREYCVKFLVTVTMQGTPINVSGPYPGRMHDFMTCKEGALVVRQHFVSDVFAADLGYMGMRHHTLLPHKKPYRQPMSQLDEQSNKLLGRYRSRVEHCFSTMKSRWPALSNTVTVRDINVIGGLFRIAALSEHYIQHKANKVLPRYATCRQHVTSVRLPRAAPTTPCTCSFLD